MSKKVAPAWVPKIRKWCVTGMVLAIPVILCSTWASHIKASTEKNAQQRATAAAEHARAWITLSPGKEINLSLEKLTTPVRVEGVYLHTEFIAGTQLSGAHASIELDGGVMLEETPATTSATAERHEQMGHIVVHPGGKGSYRVWATTFP